MSLEPTAAARPADRTIYLVGAAIFLAPLAALVFPKIDHAVNPGASTPGVISFLGVGLSVLALTAVLLFAGLRRVLPRTGVFLAAALGYNATLVVIKFVIGPAALYVRSEQGGFLLLQTDSGFLGFLAFPGLAAVTAILYGGAFFILYAYFNSRLRRRLGINVGLERRVVTLFVAMFVIAAVGGLIGIGLLGFFEYALSFLALAVLAALLAGSLVAAVVLCSVAFHEATEQAELVRNVTLLSTFAWIGLAFIAAYHVVWLVFILTLVSLWPLRAMNFK